jgi:hypothetical protein
MCHQHLCSKPSTSSSQQHQRDNQDLHHLTEAQGDVQQDFEEEINAVIKAELVCLR